MLCLLVGFVWWQVGGLWGHGLGCFAGGWLLRFVCAYIKVLVDFVVLDWSCAC